MGKNIVEVVITVANNSYRSSSGVALQRVTESEDSHSLPVTGIDTSYDIGIRAVSLQCLTMLYACHKSSL